MPQWCKDESLAARVEGNEIFFHEANNFDRFTHKMGMQAMGITSFCLAPAGKPLHVAAYMPGQKGSPSFVRVFQYPNLKDAGAAVASKSFFKADRIEFKWNSKGNALLVVAMTDVDQSGKSYYGEQILYLVLTAGESSRIELSTC